LAVNGTEVENSLRLILHHIMEKKGEDIIVIDLRGVSSVSDFFIITTGTSDVHIKAIADEVREKLKKEHSIVPWHIEGYEARKWVLMDYVDIVVHIFDSRSREYYSLESLWKDARIERIETDY